MLSTCACLRRYRPCSLRLCLGLLSGFCFLFVYSVLLPANAGERWITPGVVAAIPFEDDGTPIIIPVTINDTTHSFLLDTNCTSTIIDESRASGLKKLSSTSRVQTAGTEIVVSRYMAPAIRIQELSCNELAVINALDLKQFGAVIDKDIHGILGMDVLKNFSLHIDFDNKIVLLCDSAKVSKPPGISVPLLLDEQIFPCISAHPEGIRFAAFRVDTGMTATGDISAEDFDSLRVAGLIASTGIAARVVGGDGLPKSEERGRCGRFHLADKSHKDLIFSPGQHNVLGLSFLRRYRVTLDFVGGKAYFEPSKYFALRDRNDYEGVVLDKQMVVRKLVSNSIGDRAGFKVADKVIIVDGKNAGTLSWEGVNRMLSTTRESDMLIKVQRGKSTVDITLPGG